MSWEAGCQSSAQRHVWRMKTRLCSIESSSLSIDLWKHYMYTLRIRTKCSKFCHPTISKINMIKRVISSSYFYILILTSNIQDFFHLDSIFILKHRVLNLQKLENTGYSLCMRHCELWLWSLTLPIVLIRCVLSYCWPYSISCIQIHLSVTGRWVVSH